MAMNVLVFPCGSEIGLEIHRALVNKKGINLIGLSSVDDHGKYIYGNYGYCPMLDDIRFIDHLRWVIKEFNIDVIYPANDAALLKLKQHEHELCKVVGPSPETVETCNSKSRTYKALSGICKVPKLYPEEFPVFIKPDVGHSGMGCKVAFSQEQVLAHMDSINDIVTEYLPGREYTIDCFADQYAEGRERKAITKGIASSTTIVKDPRFQEMTTAINSVLDFPDFCRGNGDGIPGNTVENRYLIRVQWRPCIVDLYRHFFCTINR